MRFVEMEKKMSAGKTCARMSAQTRKNWLIDAALFLSALAATASGVYFLFVTSGGYQGGRNPFYGVTILFDRLTWDNLHTWGGVLMIIAAAVHVVIHWGWVKTMTRRVVNIVFRRGGGLSRGGWVNVLVDLAIALSFVVTAISGVYFLLIPAGGFEGGRNPAWDPNFLFPRATWDAIHTWGGVILIVAALVHFYIHWRWVRNVTVKFFASLWPHAEPERAPAPRP